MFAFSQTETKHKPYISAGPGIGTGILTYGMEIGGYTDKVWYCAVAELTPLPDHTNSIYAGLKAYYSVSKFDDKTQLFVYFAGKVGKQKDLVLEPGLAFVRSFNSHWGLQWNLSSPMYEETSGPLHLSTGLSLNYWF